MIHLNIQILSNIRTRIRSTLIETHGRGNADNGPWTTSVNIVENNSTPAIRSPIKVSVVGLRTNKTQTSNAVVTKSF